MSSKLLTAPSSQPKAVKGERVNVLTTVMHLAPARAAGDDLPSICTSATGACIAACLNTAGRGGIVMRDGAENGVQVARIRRTRLYWQDRELFLGILVAELETHARAAARRGMTGAVRLNGTSDVVWERAHPVVRRGVVYPSVMDAFAELTFYDYTKHATRVLGALQGRRALPANYTLTYSFTGAAASLEASRRILELGGTVAVVFSTRRGRALPATWQGAPVLDGDVTDVRFSDPAGHVVGLRAKGRAKSAPTGGFVQEG
jgi:hypothetical protein